MGVTVAVLAFSLGLPWEPTRLPAPKMQAGSGLRPIGLALHGAEERYDQIPFEGDLDSVLQDLLRRADEDEELNGLFKKLRQNSNLKSPDAQLLKQLEGGKQQWLRGELLELARSQKDGGISRKALEELLDKLLKFQQLAKDLEGITLPDFRAVPQLELDAEQRLERWTRDWLQDLDDTAAGDFFRDSPAWQNALRGLEQYVKNADGNLDWLSRAAEGWRLPEAWRPKLGAWNARLPSVNLPNLPRWRGKLPNLGRWNVNLNPGGGVRLGAPSLGALSVSDNVFWVLLLLLLALLGWVFYHKLGRAPALAAVRQRGPWPVDPAGVATRTQLIQAFDYLALLLLGDEVRTWNHLAVARKLGEQKLGEQKLGEHNLGEGAEPTRRGAARALAQLYELARYTPGDDDALPPEVQAAARRHLVHLAGRAAA